MGCCGTKPQVEEPKKMVVTVPPPPAPIQIIDPKASKEELIKKYKNTLGHDMVHKDMACVIKAVDEGFQPDWVFDYEGEQVTLIILSVLFRKRDLFKDLVVRKQNFYTKVGEDEFNLMYFVITSSTLVSFQLLLSNGYDLKQPICKSNTTVDEFISEKLEDEGFMDEDHERFTAIKNLINN